MFSPDDDIRFTIDALTAPKAGTCMAPAPFAPATRGGFRVRHAELPLQPAEIC
ncbi:hypothetical protein [Streptomyces griseus]|uniref:hypothetical protein n=1 Tax=Streptomyces griseus TaxID=1911 RepID=UPI000A4777CA|nr:hypothetical protein [Streptomyces griseus]